MVDYGNTKTPSKHHRLGSAALSWLVFPGNATRISHERNPSRTIQLLKKVSKTTFFLTPIRPEYTAQPFVVSFKGPDVDLTALKLISRKRGKGRGGGGRRGEGEAYSASQDWNLQPLGPRPNAPSTPPQCLV